MNTILSEQLELQAKEFLKKAPWSAECILNMGVDLAVAVNKAPGLSGKEKSELVVQTILKLLDDAEKADKEHVVESTAQGATTTPSVDWALLKTVVKTMLPTTLDLTVSAARGQYDLKKTSSCLLGCLAVWASSKAPVAPSVAAPGVSLILRQNSSSEVELTEPPKAQVNPEGVQLSPQ